MKLEVELIDAKERRPMAAEVRGSVCPSILLVGGCGALEVSRINYDKTLDDKRLASNAELPLVDRSWYGVRYWALTKTVTLKES